MTAEAGNELAGRVLTIEQAAALAEELRAAGKLVVFTNGCFDLLHRGHVDYLQRARGLGDFLFVGLNGDGSVRRLKGPGRPILPETDRAEVLIALRAVDAVVIFSDDTAESLVQAIRPDTYVKGGDWQTGSRRPPEAAVVESYGGRVAVHPVSPRTLNQRDRGADQESFVVCQTRRRLKPSGYYVKAPRGCRIPDFEAQRAFRLVGRSVYGRPDFDGLCVLDLRSLSDEFNHRLIGKTS